MDTNHLLYVSLLLSTLNLIFTIIRTALAWESRPRKKKRSRK